MLEGTEPPLLEDNNLAMPFVLIGKLLKTPCHFFRFS